MIRKAVNFLLVLMIVFSALSPATAKSTEAEIRELKERIVVLEEKLDEEQNYSEAKSNFSDEVLDGLSIGAGATFIIQGAHNANNDESSDGYSDVTDGSYSADLEFEKAFDDYGLAFIHLETGDGAGIEDELQVFSNVNRDADDSDNGVSLTEAWYEQYLGSTTLTFGKIDASGYLDTNEYANDECSQFLGHIFRNSPVIEFPDDNGAGLRTAFAPSDFWDVELLIADADGDWEDIFSDAYFSGQLNFKPEIASRPGNYRLYGWVNNKDHIKWTDEEKTKEKNYGLGLSFDQELSDIFGCFARYGWQNPKVYNEDAEFSLEQSWSAGIQASGIAWGREDDVLGLAFGQVMPSDEYKKSADLKADTESHMEAYYNFKVNEHLSISPDLQIIWDPYGGDAESGNKTIFVGGMRSQVDF